MSPIVQLRERHAGECQNAGDVCRDSEMPGVRSSCLAQNSGPDKGISELHPNGGSTEKHDGQKRATQPASPTRGEKGEESERQSAEPETQNRGLFVHYLK